MSTATLAAPAPVLAEPIPAAGDLILQARDLAAALESAARGFQAVKDHAADPDRLRVARLLASASVELSDSLRAWAGSIDTLERRRLDGLALEVSGPGVPGPDPSFVARCRNLGNIVRTRAIEFAELWPDEAAVREWLGSLRTPRGSDARGKPWPAPIRLLGGRTVRLWRVAAAYEPTSTAYAIKELPLDTAREG